jgi:hypothetical protein
MSNDGLRLLISSTPLWQQGAMDHPLPVHVTQVYMVMGKRGNLWQTVLSSTDDVYAARNVMHAANKSKQFDRLVISEGQSVNKAPATRWTTIETVFPTASAFDILLKKIREKTANGNPLPKHAFLHGHKQSQNFLLGLACFMALLNQSPIALGLVGLLALVDLLFMLNAQPLSTAKAKFFNDARNWTYATVNGVLLLMLLVF